MPSDNGGYGDDVDGGYFVIVIHKGPPTKPPHCNTQAKESSAKAISYSDRKKCGVTER